MLRLRRGVVVAAEAVEPWQRLEIEVAGERRPACADTALVVSSLLQAPNNALNAAHPVGGLPRLQAELFGSAVMGYGDLFVAGVLGGLLAATGQRVRQSWGALLVALLAISLDLLFFAVDELPATVPVAAALVILLRIGSPSGRSSNGCDPELSGRGVASTGAGLVSSRSDFAPDSSMRRSCGSTRLSNDPTASL